MGAWCEMFSYQYWLRRLLLWLIEEEANLHPVNKLKKGTHESMDLKIEENLSKEELAEKFELLKTAFEDLRGKMTVLEFEVEHLKDEKVEKEEEIKLQRVELQKLIEFAKILKQEREGDKQTIMQQKEIIKSIRKDLGIRDFT